MRSPISLALVLGIAGLILGYVLFAKFGDSYIPVQDLLFGGGDSILKKLGNAVRGVEEVRRKILFTGAGGAVIGLVIGFVRK
jgi:hypothetical protein